MPGRLMRGFAAAIALGAALTVASPAAGHALLQSSDPSAGANLSEPPAAVTLTFGERPDPKLSTIKVLDTSGASVTSGAAQAVPSDPLQLRIPLAQLGSGVYTVAWRTVSAVDGHLATGSFAFGVATTPPSTQPASAVAGGEGGSAPLSPLAIAGRWLLYVGLIGLVGSAFVSAVIHDAPPAILRRVVPPLWLAAFVGTLAVLGVQLSEAGVDPVAALSTSLGGPIVGRLAPLVVALLGGVWFVRRPTTPGGGRALLLVGVGAAAAMLADAAASHAGAGDLPILNIFIQWIHVLAVGTWLGGVVALVITLRGAAGETSGRAARRFSNSAFLGIVLVGVTGVLRAISEVGSVGDLVSTDFGRLVIVKSGLLLVLAGLGAVNHFVTVPNAHRVLGPLRRVASTEVLIGLVVLVLSSALVNLAPPVSAHGGMASGLQPSPSASPGAGPLVATGADFGTSVRARLEVSPGSAGFNSFTLTATDYDSGAPVGADSVSLRFAIPARPDVGESRLDLASAGAGVYRGTGANLSLDGSWQVTVLVARSAGSVEVPLEVQTRTIQQQVDVNQVPGQLTIYTVHLAGGRTVQIYLDPGKPGKNELHATFFDPTGNELPVQTATMSLGRSGGAVTQLKARQLEPGHFVADTGLAVGTYAVSVSGPAPTPGEPLTARLDIPVTK